MRGLAPSESSAPEPPAHPRRAQLALVVALLAVVGLVFAAARLWGPRSSVWTTVITDQVDGQSVRVFDEPGGDLIAGEWLLVRGLGSDGRTLLVRIDARDAATALTATPSFSVVYAGAGERREVSGTQWYEWTLEAP